MKKLKEYGLIIILVLFVLGFLFYWYELRPTNIVKKCNQWVESSQWDSSARKMGDKYWRAPRNSEIEMCLGEHGIKK
jgi:hypothetical protein